MAKLRGSLFGEKGVVTRLANRTITSRLETWDVEVRTELDADNTVRVYVGDKGDARTLAYSKKLEPEV